MSSIYQRNGSRFWWIKYRDRDGSIKRESLETTRPGIARERQKEIDRRLKERRISTDTADLEDLVAVFSKTLKATTGEQHWSHQIGRLNRFIEWAKIKDPEEITRAKIQDFLTELQIEKAKPLTIRGYRAALSKFCQFLVDRAIFELNPATKIIVPKAPKRLPRYLSPEECEQALKWGQENNLYGEILTALYTGMRQSELAAFSWEHVNFPNRLITIKGKGGKIRTVPMADCLREYLEPLKKRRGRVFPERERRTWCQVLKPIQNVMPTFTENMGQSSTGRGWHLFRHTFASRVAQSGQVDLYRLKEWLGHGTIAMTEIYAHLMPSKFDNAINKI